MRGSGPLAHRAPRRQRIPPLANGPDLQGPKRNEPRQDGGALWLVEKSTCYLCASVGAGGVTTSCFTGAEPASTSR